jgi:hypothetical protein
VSTIPGFNVDLFKFGRPLYNGAAGRMDMIRMRCVVQDFMTREPIQSCVLQARLVVAPRFQEQFAGPDDDKPLLKLLPDLTLAREFIREVVTPADGRGVFDFEVTSVFRDLERIERDGVRATDAMAYAEFRAVCDSLDRERASPRELREDDAFETVIALDFGKTIVGHTTPTSTTLWFCLHGTRGDGEAWVCEFDRADAADATVPLRRVEVEPNPDRANTAVLVIDGLEPATHYRYVLRFQSAAQQGQPRTGRVLVSGELRTFSDAADANRLAFAFGSCHLPVHHSLLTPLGDEEPEGAALQMLERLGRLTLDRVDMLLLTGDQVYADGIEDNFPLDTWRERFEKRYHQVWEYPEFRAIVSSRSTLMMLDDHEVKDDFGTVSIEEEQRVSEGIRAYQIFQHAHNPSPFEGRLHYHFRRGAAAFFVLDTRTRRSPNSIGDSPVLGEQQFNDLRDWARSAETRASDVIILVTSVPFAWLPVEFLRKAAEDFGQDLGTGLGFIAGTIITPAALALGALGYAIGDILAGRKFRAHLNDPDFEDQWTFGPNQPELARVLTLLYDLANDLNPDTGQPRPSLRKRAVFVLGGDVHMGAVHLIRSNHAGGNGGRNHQANPLIYQFTSSPLSHPPEPDERYRLAIEHISDKIGVNILEALGPVRLDLSQSGFVGKLFNADELFEHLPDEPATFVLDSEGARMYAADGQGIVPDRNFGLFSMRRLNGPRRQYEFSGSIQGPRFNVGSRFVLDLDATVVRPEMTVTVTPDDIHFGNVPVGGVATRTMTVRNAMGDPATLSIQASPPGVPFVWNAFEGTLDVGEERTFEVQFRPTSAALEKTTLTVISSAPESPHRVSLFGKGPGGIPQPPEEPELPDELTFSTKILTFGSVVIGSERTLTLTIENQTGATVTVTIAAPPSSSVFQWKAFNDKLAHGTTRGIPVTFRPKSNKIQNGTLRVDSSAIGSPHTIGLVGKGPGGFPVPDNPPPPL